MVVVVVRTHSLQALPISVVHRDYTHKKTPGYLSVMGIVRVVLCAVTEHAPFPLNNGREGTLYCGGANQEGVVPPPWDMRITAHNPG